MCHQWVKAENLYRYYGETCAVNDVSFSVARGQILGLLGSNGAGKSTTMQLITINLTPDSGRIAIGGVDALRQPRRARALLGYLPEHPPLYDELTVMEYLRYCARLRGMSRRAARAAAAEASQRCQLDAVGGRLIGHLSKGYRQRVGIAQAIIHRPAVVVLDEPTANLDPLQRQQIRRLIDQLRADCAVILSTHLLSEVQLLCDQVLILQAGRVVYSGATERVEGSQRAFVVAFAAPPTAAELLALRGIEAVTATTTGRFQLQLQATAAWEQSIEELVAAAVAKGWGLRELTPAADRLERAFIALTTGADLAAEALA